MEPPHITYLPRTTVYITLPGGRRSRVKGITVTRTGVFLDDPHLGLRQGQQVVIAFAIHLGTVTKLHHRVAVVERVTPPC